MYFLLFCNLMYIRVRNRFLGHMRIRAFASVNFGQKSESFDFSMQWFNFLGNPEVRKSLTHSYIITLFLISHEDRTVAVLFSLLRTFCSLFSVHGELRSSRPLLKAEAFWNKWGQWPSFPFERKASRAAQAWRRRLKTNQRQKRVKLKWRIKYSVHLHFFEL